MTSHEKFCISGFLLARGTLSLSLSEHESSEAYITCPNPGCCDGKGVLLHFIHGPHETQFYIGKWRVSWSQSTDLSSILMLQMSKMPAVRGMVHVHSHPTPQAQGERSQRSEGNRVLSCCRLQKIARQRCPRSNSPLHDADSQLWNVLCHHVRHTQPRGRKGEEVYSDHRRARRYEPHHKARENDLNDFSIF